MKIEFFGKVDDGRLHIYNRNAFVSLLKNFDGKEIKITIERKKKTRSNPQNRYYWGCIIPAIQQGLFETQGEWISIDEVHEFLKQNFNYKELVNDKTGEILRLGITTTDKSTLEFEEYMDKCRQFADEYLNIIIPLPNEQANLYNS